MDNCGTLVTVVISTYNRPGFLREAMRSVLDQEFEHELIIVDDGSPQEIVDRYEIPAAGRLICLDRNYGDPAAARNAGIEAASGKYIAFLDDDDAWITGKLSAQVSILESNPDSALTFNLAFITDSELRVIDHQAAPKVDSGNVLQRLIHGNFICSPSCVLARRDALIECGLFDPEMTHSEDWEMWIRIAAKYPIHVDSTHRTLYRTHKGQVTGKRLKVASSLVDVYRKTLDLAEVERPDLVSFTRRRSGSALRRLAKLQLLDGDPGHALISIREAARIWPFALSNYGLALKAAWKKALSTG